MEKWLIHSSFECENCEWKEEDYKTAQKEAYKHHKNTGPKVHGEMAYSCIIEKYKVK